MCLHRRSRRIPPPNSGDERTRLSWTAMPCGRSGSRTTNDPSAAQAALEGLLSGGGMSWADAPLLTYNGSNEMNLAKVTIDTAKDFGVVAATNIGRSVRRARARSRTRARGQARPPGMAARSPRRHSPSPGAASACREAVPLAFKTSYPVAVGPSASPPPSFHATRARLLLQFARFRSSPPAPTTSSAASRQASASA